MTMRITKLNSLSTLRRLRHDPTYKPKDSYFQDTTVVLESSKEIRNFLTFPKLKDDPMLKKARTFKVTEDHLKLFSKLQIRFDHNLPYGGAPSVDPKYAFGEYDLYNSAGKILNIPKLPENDYEFTAEDRKRIEDLYQDMAIMLQIVVKNNGVYVGTYTTSNEYASDWKPETKNG